VQNKDLGAAGSIVLLIIFLLDNCGGPGITGAYLMLIGYALFGWTGFIPRIGQLIAWRWEAFWSVIISVGLLLLGGHLFVSWLYRQMGKNGDPPNITRWKFTWTVRVLVLLIVMFCAGTACIAIVHQSAWLATSPEPLFGSFIAQRVKCSGNIRQIGQGLILYANTHQGKLPDNFAPLITDADINPEVFICPLSAGEKATGATAAEMAANLMKDGHCSYIYLGKGLSLPLSADIVLVIDRPENHDGTGINILFGDLHAEMWDNKGMNQLLKKIEASGKEPTTWPVDAP
jgi:prepilin-type processing-associated H-X9-DG protein